MARRRDNAAIRRVHVEYGETDLAVTVHQGTITSKCKASWETSF
jgi:hypothetical protein